MRTFVWLCCAAALLVPGAAAQSDSDTSGLTDFDACGVLVRVGNCVLFQGGSGQYALTNTGDFREGDAVRVVGTLDPACVTICADTDGCIRGAEVYDPLNFPCGQALPDLPNDLVTGLCTAATAALSGLGIIGAWCTRRRAHPRVTRDGDAPLGGQP